MYEQKEILMKLIDSLEIRTNELRTIVNMGELNEVGETEAQGAVLELERQVRNLYRYVDQLEDYGSVTFDYEIPF